MQTRRAILGVICTTAAVVVIIWLAVEHQTRLRLGQENRALRQELSQLASLAAENARLSNLVAQASRSQSLPDWPLRELLRLRGEVGFLRQQSNELQTLRNENRQARAALESSLKTQSVGVAGAAATADYWPRDSWAFVGYASPDAALQSSFWAASKGDVKTFLGGTTGEIQKSVEDHVGGKSDSEASAELMADTGRLKSVRVVNREVQADNTVLFMTAFEEENGTETNKMVIKKIGNEWRLSGEY